MNEFQQEMAIVSFIKQVETQESLFPAQIQCTYFLHRLISAEGLDGKALSVEAR